MVYPSEKEFADYLEQLFHNWFGKDMVEREHYFYRTGRFADFILHTPLGISFAVEVENDSEHVGQGVYQSLLYAGHEDYYAPLVVVPKGHVEHPEVDILRNQVPIKEIEYNPDGVP